MLSDDVTVLNIKHKVLQEVAKLAYDKKLEEGKELLPFQMIPGPKARFRCCIYKERELSASVCVFRGLNCVWISRVTALFM